MLDDHRSGRGSGFGPDGAPADRPDDPDDDADDDGSADPVVPVRHASWLVDPDPSGWGTGGRRVVPPVLGEGP